MPYAPNDYRTDPHPPVDVFATGQGWAGWGRARRRGGHGTSQMFKARPKGRGQGARAEGGKRDQGAGWGGTVDPDPD
ncbi:hypothetical protein PAPYR_11998 [Paratrimastix pyriformis]|uniref:Uncharacterized protein n=1 Tax=Paratrimastix pyriformis TaxID=342808 RepID=A0ABQ8U4B7_9EUKA|nr:hypothetical protein PAPYR_11998 [Paratrimastix pyriformis]